MQRDEGPEKTSTAVRTDGKPPEEDDHLRSMVIKSEPSATERDWR